MEPKPESLRIASLLIECGCVAMRRDEPFRLPSGWASPAYMDCRRLTGFPAARREIVRVAVDRLRATGALAATDALVGAETSGIALAAWMAGALDLPLQCVRKAARGGRAIEGAPVAGSRVVLVDDLMAAGLSKLAFLDALAQAGLAAAHALVVFDYGTFGARERLAARGVESHALCTWADVLSVARHTGAWPGAALDELADFLAAPAAWSHRHGGLAAWPTPSSRADRP